MVPKFKGLPSRVFVIERALILKIPAFARLFSDVVLGDQTRAVAVATPPAFE
jgi:hypothetical protein